MYGAVYSSMLNAAAKEGFASGGSTMPLFWTVIGIAFLIILQLYIVMWLWNNVLTRVVTVAKPIPSLLYTLGLLILVAMVSPGSAVAV